MNKKIGLVIGVIVLLILIIGLPFAVRLVQERQNLQKQAAVPGGSATVSLSSPNTAIVQQKIPVIVSVKVPNSPNGILGIRTVIKITSSGDSSLVNVTASDIENSFGNTLNYYAPIINTDGATTSIVIQAAYTGAGTTKFTGASGDSFVSFAVINLLPTGPGSINVDFDMTDSYITDANSAMTDIMNDQAGGKSITITSDAAPTATATPTTPAGIATATPTPTTGAGATATPTTRASATATPTTTTGQGGGTSLTNTPTPTRTIGATNTPTPIASTDQVKLTSVASGQTVPTSRPTLSGTAAPNSTVTITVRSDPITATVTADASGRWTWTPTEDLTPGSHSITITAVSPQGKTTTTTSTITVGSLPATGNVSLTILLLGFGLLILLPVFVVLVKKAPANS